MQEQDQLDFLNKLIEKWTEYDEPIIIIAYNHSEPIIMRGLQANFEKIKQWAFCEFYSRGNAWS